jgi:hypothetical protein
MAYSKKGIGSENRKLFGIITSKHGSVDHPPNLFLTVKKHSSPRSVYSLKAAEKSDTWWERANKKLAESTLKTRFTLNKDGKVEVTPAVLPEDYEETRLLFEIVDDVFAMLEEEAEEAELDQPDS